MRLPPKASDSVNAPGARNAIHRRIAADRSSATERCADRRGNQPEPLASEPLTSNVPALTVVAPVYGIHAVKDKGSGSGLHSDAEAAGETRVELRRVVNLETFEEAPTEIAVVFENVRSPLTEAAVDPKTKVEFVDPTRVTAFASVRVVVSVERIVEG